MIERTRHIPATSDFVEMMTDLHGVIEEARDEGYPPPSDLAVSNAKLLLERLYRFAPRRFEVYPTPDAEIAIDATGKGCSVVLLCDSNGSVLCMANLPDGYFATRTEEHCAWQTCPTGIAQRPTPPPIRCPTASFANRLARLAPVRSCSPTFLRVLRKTSCCHQAPRKIARNRNATLRSWQTCLPGATALRHSPHPHRSVDTCSVSPSVTKRTSPRSNVFSTISGLT